MKKLLAIVLAVILVLSMSATVFAQDYCNNFTSEETRDANDNKTYTISYKGLDFNEKNNVWATYDDETGKWVSSNLQGFTFTDGDVEIYGLYNSKDDTYSMYDEETGKFTTLSSDEFWDDDFYSSTWYYPNNAWISGAHGSGNLPHLEWSLSADGEYLTLTSIDTSAVPGIFFDLEDSPSSIVIGAEPKATHIAIRVRNNSSASKIGFGWVTNVTNGGTKFMDRTTTNADIEPNSGEWKTYVLDMGELNAAMAHDDNGTGNAWGGLLCTFAIFPFGYNVTDGTGSYKSASLDIDYIVIGTEDYCKNYKSELQAREESVTSIELVSAPKKNVYYVGDTIDLTGLQIKATYDDGTTEIITDCTRSYDFTSENDNATVTLKYGTTTTPITYNVKVIGIDHVEIAETPTTTTFKASEVASGFSTSHISGLKINVTFKDGTIYEGIIPSVNNVTISDTAVGEQIVTVNYYGGRNSEGALPTFKVNVINVESITVDDIGDVKYNTAIDKSKLTIKCIYTDGTEATLSDSGLSDYVQDPVYDTTVFGESTLSVSIVNDVYHINVTGTSKINVLSPSSIEVTNLPESTVYAPESKLDTTGLVISFVYEDGSKVPVLAEDYTCKYDFAEPGTKTVTVEAAGFTTSFDVTVEGSIQTRATQATTSQSGGGCGSTIGAGAAIVIVSVMGAGVVLGKKKEN